MKLFSHIKNWYMRYERPISSISLIGGFIQNALLLKRVDLFLENFWVILHIIIIGICILLINDIENKHDGVDSIKSNTSLHFWLIIILQFTFGGLLSTYLVFYFRSTALAVTWPFILLLGIAFIANERLRKQYNRVLFQISLYYLAIFSFTIFFVPVVMKQITVFVFIISGVISLLLITCFLVGLRLVAPNRFSKHKNILFLTVAGIFLVINILYFLNVIPPIPLSLKDAGVYHDVYRNMASGYTTSGEQKTWKDYFSFKDVVHIQEGQPVYLYSAIFSPADFQTDVIHEWQRYDNAHHRWVTISEIPLQATGGRDGGYRTYSKKSSVQSGAWRVNIKTTRGQVIGRLRFNVVFVDQTPVLVNETEE